MNVARLLALFVAAAFVVAPLVIGLSLLADDDLTWAMGALAVVYVLGAVLLAVGTKHWYGSKARLLRVWGFVLLLAGALANLSFAFLLVPLALLAAPALRRRERADSNVATAGFQARWD
jgi:hypothetical protein